MDKLRERIFMTISSGVENVEITDQITAAIMALIKPKELVWGGGAQTGFLAGSVIGEFCVYYCSQYGWLIEIDGHDDQWVKYPDSDFGFETQEEAKAAAQANYNRMFYDMMGVR